MRKEKQFSTASLCRKSYAKPSLTSINISVSSIIAESEGGTIGSGEDIPIEGASGMRSSNRYFQNRFDYGWQDDK